MDDEYLSLDAAPPRIVVEFIQNEKSLGVVEVKDFHNSGEVPNLILPEAIKHWNALPVNVSTGVRAAMIIAFGDEPIATKR
jgi:hypothetical protein